MTHFTINLTACKFMHFTVYLTVKLHIGNLAVILRPFITVYAVE